jgi:hypothetical protein
MTLTQLEELPEKERTGALPRSIAPYLPEIFARCMTRIGQRIARAGGPNGADSLLVALALGRLRMEEEIQDRGVAGHPVALPTGRCTSTVTLGEQGRPQGGFPVHWSIALIRA